MKKFFGKEFTNPYLILFFILLLSGFFRFYNLNWDQNTHLHPDERFLTMVETALDFPKSISEYLDTKNSPLNPYNRGYGFFVYGTFPIFLTKYVGHFLKMEGYDSVHFVGRFLSGLFDLGTVFLLFLIGKKIWEEKAGLLAAFLYGITVLPIQLSHFFAVDTFLNFFIVLSFYFLILFLKSPSLILHNTYYILLSGVSLGLAMASKINAILFLPIILLGILLKSLGRFITSKKKSSFFISLITNYLLLITFCYLSFRFFQPYAFVDKNLFNFKINPQFINNLKELKSFDDPNGFFPPAIQWMSTKPIVFPLKNMILWGMGLPLGVLSLISFFYSTFQLINQLLRKNRFKSFTSTYFYTILIVLWILFFFLYQGTQFTKNMRYFLIIYPFLILLSAQFSSKILDFLRKKFPCYFFILHNFYFILLLIYPLSFISIYTHKLSRVTASDWINKNIPPGSTLSCDLWDDCLPVYGGNRYQIETLDIFAPDKKEKWQKINQQLQKIDYLILSSNRAWGSIPKVPKKYPITAKFYNDLFLGKLNFKKVTEFTSFPCFPPIGKSLFCFPDQSADESFTVYDHPKVMIFKKI